MLVNPLVTRPKEILVTGLNGLGKFCNRAKSFGIEIVRLSVDNAEPEEGSNAT